MSYLDSETDQLNTGVFPLGQKAVCHCPDCRLHRQRELEELIDGIPFAASMESEFRNTPLPEMPKITPRFMQQNQFTPAEKLFADKAWRLAVCWTVYANWFLQFLKERDQATRRKLWNGESRFPGNYGDAIPKIWFGSYNETNFENVSAVVERILDKFLNSAWKMKRQNCLVWAAAHVIIFPQLRLCNDFFKNMSDDRLPGAALVLVHEMAHHIWIKTPRRQVSDRHFAPLAPCNPCYGPDNAKMLAQSYVKHAVANNDNYAYFIRRFGSNLPSCN